MRVSSVLTRFLSPTDGLAKIGAMRVAVIDIGSNTARLLVATAGQSGPVALREERAFLALGAEILRHGAIGEMKLADTADVARRFARIARKLAAERIEVVITAPGRQGTNPDELVDVLARATRAPVRVLTADEEGVLAYRGAVLRADLVAETVAVSDVGGGSTEITVGSPPNDPSWSRSFNLGSLRLTAAHLHSDPPSRRELANARAEAERCLEEMIPPRPQCALAVGGSARGLARLVGRQLDEDALAAALRIASERRATKLASAFGFEVERARVLPAGAIILAELVRRLGVPFSLARGGLREGMAVELLAEIDGAPKLAQAGGGR